MCISNVLVHFQFLVKISMIFQSKNCKKINALGYDRDIHQSTPFFILMPNMIFLLHKSLVLFHNALLFSFDAIGQSVKSCILCKNLTMSLDFCVDHLGRIPSKNTIDIIFISIFEKSWSSNKFSDLIFRFSIKFCIKIHIYFSFSVLSSLGSIEILFVVENKKIEIN